MGVFTAISTAVALGSAVQSFSQASKQRTLQKRAEAEAEKSMADARKRLGVNYAEGIGIQKEAYELEREALIAAGAQALQAGAEGELRGAGATAGRVQMAQQEGQREIATAMGQEMLGLEKAAAAEDARIASQLASLDLEEVRGAQLAARDAERRADRAMAQGVQSAGAALERGLEEFVPLYKEQKEEAGGKGAFDVFSQSTIQKQPGLENFTTQQIQDLINAGIIKPEKIIQ
jgi:hypothetical protein